MSHIEAEIRKHLSTASVVGRKEVNYRVELFSKDKKWFAEFVGQLKIRKVEE